MNTQAQIHILQQLKDLQVRLERIKIQYEFHDFLQLHVIEILLFERYEYNDAYILVAKQLEKAFYFIYSEEEFFVC